MIPSKEKLEQYLEILQCIMRIQDWDIKVEYKTKEQFSYMYGDSKYLGYCTRFRKHKEAVISLNSDELNDPENDWYKTFIHELYHVVTDDYISHIDSLCSKSIDGVNQESTSDTITGWYERLVNELTRIFVSVYPMDSLTEDESEEGEENA